MRLVLLHTMDPRGHKLGGIETHVRLVIERHPAGTELLFVGIDEIGDLPLGQVRRIEVAGRSIDFLPVVHIPVEAINVATKRLFQSTTLRYTLGLLRYLPVLFRRTRGGNVSCEIERYEFAPIVKLLGLPLVMLVHNEGSKDDKMDSLLKRYWAVRLLSERLSLWLSDWIFGVNAAIVERIAALSPRWRDKAEVMSVSVDTDRFHATAFPPGDAFHICFAGRLDAFKDPPLMFRTLAVLDAKLSRRAVGRFRRVVFDYVGASDPAAIEGYGAIERLIVRHGPQPAAQVASIVRQAHAGIITSFFEGLPCYLLEMLGSGRPVAAIHLPQFEPLIVEGKTGKLVSRQADPQASADVLSDAFLEIVAAIEGDSLRPDEIAPIVRPYSVEAQMHRLFARHERLARRLPPGGYASESMRSA